MANKLSHSSVSKFQECPQAWDYHYNQKLRSKLQSAALCYGTAIDKALEALLIGKSDPYETFFDVWSNQRIGKEISYLPDNTDIVYSDSDVDLDLLDDKQRLFLKDKFGNWETLHKDILEKKERLGFKNLSVEDRKVVNLVAWHCLKTKGDLMITAFKQKIQPRIKKVLALQKEITLTNSDGDKIIGYADLVCEWEDESIVVVDFKTSTRNYEEDAVLTSPQLSLYVYCLLEEYNTRKAGYIVLNKRISKNKVKICPKCGYNGTGGRHKTCPDMINDERCNAEWLEKINPEVYIQVLIDEIPEQTEKIVMENIDFINASIKTGVFHRNLQSCVKPWGKCPYFNLCYKDDKSDLIEG